MVNYLALALGCLSAGLGAVAQTIETAVATIDLVEAAADVIPSPIVFQPTSATRTPPDSTLTAERRFPYQWEVRAAIKQYIRRKFNNDCREVFANFDVDVHNNLLDEAELFAFSEALGWGTRIEMRAVGSRQISERICSGACTRKVFMDLFCPGLHGSARGGKILVSKIQLLTLKSKPSRILFADPHFATWYGNHFNYQGSCDLVFIHNRNFDQGRGLDLHVRTEHMMNKAYSFISNAALRIGDDTLEVVADGRHFINGHLNAPIPTLIGGYPVINYVKEVCRRVDEHKGCYYYKQYNITLGPEDQIAIRVASDMVHVDVYGSHDKVTGSVGIMGTYPSENFHGKMARDRVTEILDENRFAEHWQVLDTEPKLFQGPRYPQHPDKCIPAVEPQSSQTTRNLRQGDERKDTERRIAEEACSHLNGHEWDSCVFDVIATGDESVAATIYGNL